ncbi:hypothetical protein [Lentzea sp. NPDC060358]
MSTSTGRMPGAVASRPSAGGPRGTLRELVRRRRGPTPEALRNGVRSD